MDVAPPEAETTFGRSLLRIASSLWAARVRLHHRTQRNVVNLNQFFVAFYLYSRHCDRVRSEEEARAAAEAAELRSAGRLSYTRREPIRPQLRRCFDLAAAAYKSDAAELGAAIGAGDHGGHGGPAGPAAGPATTVYRSRHESTALNPAYYLAFDAVLQAVVLAVRGTKDPGDNVTNLRYDTVPFAGSYGHAGVVTAAHNVLASVGRDLVEFLEAMAPTGGLLVVGHSLGAAVATLVTILIRRGALETGGFVQQAGLAGRELPHVGRAAASAACFAFSAPPCVSYELSRAAKKNFGVTTVVVGLDMVPRLSEISVENLLVDVLNYDWRKDIMESRDAGLDGALAESMGKEKGSLVKRELRRAMSLPYVGAPLVRLAPASMLVGAAARKAYSAAAGSEKESPGDGAPRKNSSKIKPHAAVAAVAAGGLAGGAAVVAAVGGGVRQALWRKNAFVSDDGGQKCPDLPEAGNTAVMLRPLFLAGRVLHVDASWNDESLSGVLMLDRKPEYFQSFQPSISMLRDHLCGRVQAALERGIHQK